MWVVFFGDGWAGGGGKCWVLVLTKGFVLSLFSWQGKQGVCGKGDKSGKKINK